MGCFEQPNQDFGYKKIFDVRVKVYTSIFLKRAFQFDHEIGYSESLELGIVLTINRLMLRSLHVDLIKNVNFGT